MDSCVLCGRPAAHTHHRKLRSQGGTDDPVNLIRLCLACHNVVHDHPAESYEKGWLVHSWDEPTPLAPIEEHEHEGTCSRCGAEMKAKPRKRFEGEARRKRTTISVKVPNDTEDGGAIWDETLEDVKVKLVREGLYEEDARIPAYEALIAALRDWLSS